MGTLCAIRRCLPLASSRLSAVDRAISSRAPCYALFQSNHVKAAVSKRRVLRTVRIEQQFHRIFHSSKSTHPKRVPIADQRGRGAHTAPEPVSIMDTAVREAIQQIHTTPMKAVIFVTGGGVQVLFQEANKTKFACTCAATTLA